MKRFPGMIKALTAGALLFGGSLFAQVYELDKAHTEIGFSVKHLMITNVKGEFKEYDGMVDFDPKKNVFNAFEGSVKVKTIDTGITKRDEHLRSIDFFYAEKFPKMTFKMTGYKADGDEGEMMGDLTIRGVTKPVVFEVEIGGIVNRHGKEKVGFELEGKINRTDFGLNWNDTLEAGGVLVGEKVRITIDAQAERKK